MSSSWRLLALLCVVALASCISYDEFGHNRFTYYPSQTAGSISEQFFTGSSFFLHYFGTTTDAAAIPKWILPSSCSFQGAHTANSNPAEVRCTTPGEHRFTVHENGDDTTADTWNILFTDNNGKYSWAVSDSALTSLVVSAGSASRQLLVWAVDPDNASADELSGAALVPSAASKLLTQGLYSIGMTPVIQLAEGSLVTVTTDITYDSTTSTWSLNYTAPAMTLERISVLNNGVAFFGAAVADSVHLLSVTSFGVEPTTFVKDVAGTIGAWTTGWTMRVSTVNPNLMIARPTGAFTHFRFSPDGFRNQDEMYHITKGALTGTADTTAESFTDIAFIGSTIIVLTATGDIYQTTGTTWTAALTGQTVASIHAPPAFDWLRTHSYGTSPVNLRGVAVTAAKAFYVTQDGGVTWTAESVNLEVTAGFSTTILDVEVSASIPDRIVVVSTDGAVKRTFFHTIGGSTVDAGVVDESTIIPWSTPVPFRLSIGATVSITPNQGMTWATVTPYSRDPTRPAAGLGGGETWKQGAAGAGAGAIVTTTGRVFSNLLGSTTLHEIAAGISVTDTTSLVLTLPLPNMVFIYTPTAAFAGVSSRVIPLINELTSTPLPAFVASTGANGHNERLACPFDSLQWNLTTDVPLDMGEAATATATGPTHVSVTQSEPVWLTMALAGSSAAFSQTSSTISTASVAARTASTRDVSLVWDIPSATPKCLLADVSFPTSPMEYITEQYKVATTKTFSHVQTATALDRGAAPLNPTARVMMGCPPGRHIRVEGVSFNPEDCPNFKSGGSQNDFGHSFSIWTYLRPGATVDSSLAVGLSSYDIDTFGCPVSVYHGTTGYKPTLYMYDGPTKVKRVDGDFVVYELRGRTDFGYSWTESAASCTHGSQTWSIMADQSSGDAVDSWTSTNYIPCTSDTSLSYGSDDVYEILSESTENALKFTSNGADGVYVFRAVVVDPDFSYCDLTVDFALDTYGAPLSVFVTFVVVLAGIVLSGCSVCVSYIWYKRRKFMFRKH